MWILSKNSPIYPYAQDMEGLTSDLQELSNLCAQSLMWRSKPSQSSTWLKRLKRVSWIQPLSLRTLKPSLGSSIVTKWTSSLGASLVNHLARPDEEPGMKTLGTYGPTSSKGLESWEDLPLFSLKTSKGSSQAFSAAEVGAPHQRKRVFIFGVRDDLKQSGYDFISRRLRGCEPVEYSNNSTNNTSRYDTDFDRKTALQGWKELSQLKYCRSGSAYPKGRGREQYFWEPPRVNMEHTECDGLQNDLHERRSDADKSQNEQAARSPWSCSFNRTEALGYTNDKRLERHQAKQRTTAEENDRCTTDEFNDTTNSPRNKLYWKTQSPVGRDAYGASDRMDFAELSESCDSRVDELRMLGNGVVPDTAARAFKVLFNRLSDQA